MKKAEPLRVCINCIHWQFVYNFNDRKFGLCNEDLLYDNVRDSTGYEDQKYFTSSLFVCPYHQFESDGSHSVVEIPNPND